MRSTGMETVGIIGTGEIGSRMSRRLAAAGYSVICYDKRPEALRSLRQGVLSIAADIGELARKSDVVITCVTDGHALEEVIGGENGLRASLGPGKTVIDMTSAEPWITRALAPKLEAQGIRFLDAPVSGGVPAAEAGRMNFMVGGDSRDLERWRALLLRLGTVITHVGGIGSGHTVKAVNMLALAASMLATAEMLAVGRHAGFSWDRLLETMNGGVGAGYSTRVHFPCFIAPGNYASGFSFDLMRKDLSIAIGLAERSGLPLFVGRTTWELYSAAARSGFSGKDNTHITDMVSDFAPGATANPPAGLLPRLALTIAMSNTVIAAETVALGEAAELSAETVIEVVAASSGNTHALSTRLPQHRRCETPDGAVSLADAVATAAECVHIGLSQAIPVMISAQSAALHAAAQRHYGGDAPDTCVINLLRGWMGHGKAPNGTAIRGRSL